MTSSELKAYYLQVTQQRDQLRDKVSHLSDDLRKLRGQLSIDSDANRKEYASQRQQLRRLNDLLRLVRQQIDSNPVLKEGAL